MKDLLRAGFTFRSVRAGTKLCVENTSSMASCLRSEIMTLPTQGMLCWLFKEGFEVGLGTA